MSAEERTVVNPYGVKRCTACKLVRAGTAFKTSRIKDVCGECYAKQQAKPYREQRAAEERAAAREAERVAEENRRTAESLAPAFARLREATMAVAPAGKQAGPWP